MDKWRANHYVTKIGYFTLERGQWGYFYHVNVLTEDDPPNLCLPPLYSHPWETVTQAAWRKYPNPISQGVIGTDVVERKVVDGVLISHRIVSSKWFIPQWAQRVSLVGENGSQSQWP